MAGHRPPCRGGGFDTLLTADHPGSCSSPFVALAAAAAVTTTIKLGSYVSNAGVREQERRWGITRYAVRRPALDALGPLLVELAG